MAELQLLSTCPGCDVAVAVQGLCGRCIESGATSAVAWAELWDRLDLAVAQLEGMAEEASSIRAAARLVAKAAGVRLAMSYMYDKGGREFDPDR